MRQPTCFLTVSTTVLLIGIALPACAPPVAPSDADPISSVADLAEPDPQVEPEPDPEPEPADTSVSDSEPPPPEPADDGAAEPPPDPVTAGEQVFSTTLNGTLAGAGAYQRFPLGSGSAGDEWTVTPVPGALGMAFVVALFDENEDLLHRVYLTRTSRFEHVLRADTAELTLGVMVPASGGTGNFGLRATRTGGAAIPEPRPQAVWLNFGSGEDVRVFDNTTVSFDPFDAAVLGPDYADSTELIKQTIIDTMLQDYAGYNVAISVSDDGPPPEGEHSVVHFGGDANGLLGLADSVDAYNGDPVQAAIVYTDNFEPYSAMRLAPEEMAVMIANVASHELGHLLGLYHTRDPEDVMDTTGGAWDLAENQTFTRARLEESVFAFGMEDSPRLLELTVGRVAGNAKSTVATARLAPYLWARDLAALELPHTCGTCLNLDRE